MNDGAKEPLAELVEEYALGLLRGDELAAFESALSGDKALQREVAATMETLSTLAFSTPVETSAAMRERLLARVAADPRRRETSPGATSVIPLRARRLRAIPWLGAALAAACIVAVKLALDLRTATATVATADAAVAHDDRLLAERDSLLTQLTDPSTQLVTMAAQGPARPAMKVYMNTNRRTAVVAAASLETLPTGQTYQLWFIVDGKPVPSVTFRPDSAGHAMVRDIPMPAGVVAATAITREPDGGSPAPTSAVLFVGKPATE